MIHNFRFIKTSDASVSHLYIFNFSIYKTLASFNYYGLPWGVIFLSKASQRNTIISLKSKDPFNPKIIQGKNAY